jgi:hypothetical protein
MMRNREVNKLTPFLSWKRAASRSTTCSPALEPSTIDHSHMPREPDSNAINEVVIHDKFDQCDLDRFPLIFKLLVFTLSAPARAKGRVRG